MKNPKFKIVLFFVLYFWFFCFGFLIWAREARASEATLYLSPSSGSFLTGSTFTVSVFVNTNGGTINTVWADLRFPPNILQVTSPSAGNSFITEWLTPPNFSNDSGIISFKGGIPGGISTSAGLVSSITFRAVSTGAAKIKFGEQSKILLHDGQGTNILERALGGEYQILTPPPEGPRVFSPTHPDSSVWYSDSSPEFAWEKENGVTGFSWSFSQNPQERPDGISDGLDIMTSYNQVSDGIFYFHIRAQKNGIWGNTSHFEVKIDTTPPKDFSPKTLTYSRLVGYQTMVYFETSDAMSGLSHYEASLIDLNGENPSRSFFTEQISPYKIPVQTAGKYNVIIKAVDNAGNIREAETIFRVLTPLISHIDGKGLMIKGALFSWRILWAFFAIIIFILGIIIWRVVKSKTNAQPKS